MSTENPHNSPASEPHRHDLLCHQRSTPVTVREVLSELVAHPTPPAISNLLLLDWVQSFVEARGWRVERFPYHDEEGVAKANLIARPLRAAQTKSGVGGPIDLAFICHTDTAPFSLKWVKAHELTESEDGRLLCGSGVCDAKGALACFLAALDGLAGDTVQPGTALILTADEESGCKGMERLLAATDFKIRSAIVCEPTSLRPAIAGKGYGLARVTVNGIEAHSAFPSEGLSAIQLAARLITRIEGLGPLTSAVEQCAVEALFEQTGAALNVSMIEGGKAKNRIAGLCSFLVDWRPLPADPPCAVLAQLEWLADGLRVEEPRAHIHVESQTFQPGFGPGSVKVLQERLQEIVQSPRALTGIGFGSEASRVAHVADEVIAIGPGDMHAVHSESECVPLAELEEWTQTLRALLVAC